MRVISPKKLRSFWQQHPPAERPLRFWLRVAEAATWRSFAETRATFGSADIVQVKSGATVTVFDVGGNKYRLIGAVHYNTQTLFVLRVFTHREYDRTNWKNEL
jgi:mRNA interferase HigB